MTWDAGAHRVNNRPTPGQDVAHAIHGDGPPTQGVTGAGQADKGWHYIDDLTGVHYENHGTLAVPDWHGVITGESLE